ncbi:MAG TPA: hypothetical protein PKV40_07700, partial [Candidatus Kapabacteria bacterium]|nr:hypothetical protein [Candidatus Kapabacteria bacterium]
MKKVYSINFFIIFSITSLIISGCSTIDITRQDIDYVKKVNSEIDSLQFPNDKENEIWAKIQLFLSEYSNARIQIISPEHIETYQVEPLVYYIT